MQTFNKELLEFRFRNWLFKDLNVLLLISNGFKKHILAPHNQELRMKTHPVGGADAEKRRTHACSTHPRVLLGRLLKCIKFVGVLLCGSLQPDVVELQSNVADILGSTKRSFH